MKVLPAPLAYFLQDRAAQTNVRALLKLLAFMAAMVRDAAAARRPLAGRSPAARWPTAASGSRPGASCSRPDATARRS